MVALLVLMTVLVFLTVDYFVQRRTAEVTVREPIDAPVVLHEPTYRSPHGVYFDPGHVWAFLEESGSARVGIDDLARVVLGRIDRIETAQKDQQIRRGEPLIELFHGDRSVSVRSPFDGVVEEVNSNIGRSKNGDALTADWLCKVRPEDPSLMQQSMMLGKKASDWMTRELRRLRVFLSTVAPEHPVLAHTMHDGGMPYDGLVEYLSEDDWAKLKDTFFDNNTGS